MNELTDEMREAMRGQIAVERYSQPPPPKREEPNPRVTVTETVSHSVPGRKSRSTTHQFYRWLRSEEEAYERSYVVGERWRKIDRGWIERCGMLHVENEQGRFRLVPTEEERVLEMAKVIEIGLLAPSPQPVGGRDMHSPPREIADPQVISYVPVGESVRLLPPDLDSLWVRCQAGEARMIVFIVPA